MRLTKRSHKQSACCINSSSGNLILYIVGGVLFAGVLLLNALVTLNLGPRKSATNDFTTETTSLRSSHVSSTFQVATENAVEIFKTFALNPPVPKDVPYPSAISDKTFFSQVGQDEAIDMVLQQKENGFFIEVGAYDGISLSNSLFFEKSRSWTGLLIEANPRAYRELLAADRKAYTTPACISMSNKVELGVNFMAHGMVGGYANMDRYQKQHFQTDLQNNPYVYTVKANCFPLNTMLDAIGVNRVDMFSLDVEGAELAVLKSIDWSRVSIGLLIIEHNGQQKAIDEFLTARGFQQVYKIEGDPTNGRWKGSDVMYILKSEFPSHAQNR